jgi:phosphinothricin acetyltransferase
MVIRPVRVEDAQALLDIYAFYVLETTISFELEVPTLDEFAHRIEETAESYPYLVAVDGNGSGDGSDGGGSGQILGFTYAHRYRERHAYDWTVETSIYLNVEKRGMGVGSQLYRALDEKLAQQGVFNITACIAGDNAESIRFHTKNGFTEVGNFPHVGYKFDKWLDVVWMAKTLGELPDSPRPVTSPIPSDPQRIL